MEPPEDSTTFNTKSKIKRPRGRPIKRHPDCRTIPQSKCLGAQSHKTITKKVKKQHSYNIRGEQNTPNIDNRVTKHDVIKPKVTEQANANSQLPINPNTNQLIPQRQICLEMQPQESLSQNTFPCSPAKNPLAFATYFRPNKEDRQSEGPQKTDTTFEKAIRDRCSSKLIAAMTIRDSVLGEKCDCIIQEDEKRFKAVSRQIPTYWHQLSVNDGCLFIENRPTIPNSIKKQ